MENTSDLPGLLFEPASRISPHVLECSAKALSQMENYPPDRRYLNFESLFFEVTFLGAMFLGRMVFRRKSSLSQGGRAGCLQRAFPPGVLSSGNYFLRQSSLGDWSVFRDDFLMTVFPWENGLSLESHSL